MNLPFLDRQGFSKSLTGIEGSSIQSVYTQPKITQVCADKSLANASWSYPLGDPWGWSIYPWNWGKEENEANKENPTPEGTPTPGAQGSLPESTGSNVLMFAAVVAAAWFLVKGPKGVFK